MRHYLRNSIEKRKTPKAVALTFNTEPLVNVLLLMGILGIIILMASFSCEASPDSAIFKSALVWRADGLGDDVLPTQFAGTVELNRSLQVDATITSIAASWISQGVVRLEVSSDGGRHYASAVNGVPLTSGFGSGKRLKWRADMAPESKLSEVRINYTDESGVVSSLGQSELSGFKYRKAIIIKGSDTEELFNYQMRILVGASNASKDADVHLARHGADDLLDVRFTAADGQTLLPFYRERVEGSGSEQQAYFWVKVPQIPVNGITLYLYYGNSDPYLEDLSDGKGVFDLFDDFTDATVDSALWDVEGDRSESSWVAGSELHLDGATALSLDFELTDGIVEYVAKTHSSDENRLIIRSDSSLDHPEDTVQVAYASGYKGAEHCLAIGNIVKTNEESAIKVSTSYGYRVTARGTTLTFDRYDTEFSKKEAAVTFDDVGGLEKGFVGMHSDGLASFDWIRVRKRSNSEPSIDREVQMAEEAVSLPTFINTQVAPNGNLVLSDGVEEGTYVSSSLDTPFPVRILIPSWKGHAVKIAVSANAGRFYKEGIRNSAHYYASKGDFEVGSQTRFRVTLEDEGSENTAELESINMEYAAGDLFLVTPNGGEKLKNGSVRDIVWTALGYESNYPFKLKYSLNNGRTYHTIADETSNRGSYAWRVPEEAISEKALIKISDAKASSVSDTSDHVFAIGAYAQEDSEESDTLAGSSEASIDLIDSLQKASTSPNANLYELAIKVRDASDPDPEKNALNYRAGDIVLVRPAGLEWSESERDSYLIIQAHLTSEAISDLMSPLSVDTGKRDDEGKPVLRQIKKRKFKIDMAKFGQWRKQFKKTHEIKDILKDTK